MAEFEKLGAFYLGKRWDTKTGKVLDDLVLYDAKDLTTHAVCVGMTGSGKTGLCVSLLEEAAIDGVPAIAVDPKGDLANLLLTFPDLAASDFRPWIDEAEAARNGATPDAYAARVASTWKDGLASWGQDGDRIRRLRGAADLALFTPGSTAGRPIAALRSFDAPPAAALVDPEAIGDRVNSAISGLLTLLGIDADPVRSREHILLSHIVHAAWSNGRDLDLASLIREVQTPSVQRIGVLDLETFFPGGDRFGLAMRLNNLLAAPGFSSWTQGEPLDVGRLLHAPDGRPRISVLSIAHLTESERMFFVTLLLNEVVTWMRTQAGTSSLRAILYMDEVFGYFPPSAEPPSKRPMLTLLKQARAYGLGVVLATQNPVDLDYKGLSNTGTWFLGRLQTERDKARVLDGLEGVSAATGGGFDRARTEQILSGLGKRVFLLHNVHDDAPVLFHTRWAMSYLRGPLTREQIRGLCGPPTTASASTTAASPAPAVTAPWASPSAAPAPDEAAVRPTLPPGIRETFVAPAEPPAANDTVRYVPGLLGAARLHFVDAASKTDVWRELHAMTSIDDGSGDPWTDASMLGRAPRTEPEPYAGSRFESLPPAALSAKTYAAWSKRLGQYLYRETTLDLWTCPALKEWSEPGEDESAFRARLTHAARETRDVAIEKFRRKYAPKLATIQDRVRRAEERIGIERGQYEQQKTQTVISVGASVLGALFGRKLASVGTVGRATTAARGVGRTAREKQDIERAERELAAQQDKLRDLEARFEQEAAEVESSLDPTTLELESRSVRPRKSDVTVEEVVLAWIPHGRSGPLAP